ncbi:hypothetical protein [Blastopirellula marina]|uniref:hypothetical protein n=1 Tax=Blastopirellula marina TaxID=124 RepID=UPI0011B00CF4|nr:hypothetical protein [Blastopirellula marina]
MKGAIGSIKVNSWVDVLDQSTKTQGPFDSARERFYREIDWALDIREGKFYNLELHGIPARLVRRDPETQFVVTRERALQPDWRAKLSAGNRHWPFVIDLFLSDGYPDIVLVAPKRKPKKKYLELLDGLNELRELGVAEPN